MSQPGNLPQKRIPKYILTTAELPAIKGLTKSKTDRYLKNKHLIPLKGYKSGVPSSVVRELLSENNTDYSFKTIAHINLRGGIGKTTGTISLASRAVQYGFKTCIIDLDPQGSASLAFGVVPEDDDAVFYDVWQKPRESVMPSLVAIQDNFFLLPSSLQNGLLDSSLMNPVAQKRAVHDVCTVLKENGFDLVIIDCPPSLGAAIISSICAADKIVVPVCSDVFSMRGLELTLEEIKAICETFGRQVPETKILFSKFDGREKLTETSLHYLQEHYPDQLIPFYIRTSTGYAKSIAKQESVFASHNKSNPKQDYDHYTRYILGIGAN